MIPKKRSCSTLLLGFNAMVFNNYAPRCNADPLRFAFSRVSRKEGKNDGLRKGFKKKMLQWLPSFFKNPCSGSITKRMIGVPTRRMKSGTSPCCHAFYRKERYAISSMTLGRALLELRHEIKEAEIHLISGIALRTTS